MPTSPASFQDIIMRLQQYWSDQGCVLLSPYDCEMGAGTFHPATALRALGTKHWRAAYVQPSRRPGDGRYGQNPNRLQRYHQYQVLLKPVPSNFHQLYLESLTAIGLDSAVSDIRFVEDDWESPSLGAWGLGWEVWCNGMEVSQFTYFQQVAGFACKPVSGELTYGLERLAMYIQGVDSVYDLAFNRRGTEHSQTYGEIFQRDEAEFSAYNFDRANIDMLKLQFDAAEQECRSLLRIDGSCDEGAVGESESDAVGKNASAQESASSNQWIGIPLPAPAYDQCIKASHLFNLLDARGAISVTARQGYMLRVRALAKACGAAWLAANEPAAQQSVVGEKE